MKKSIFSFLVLMLIVIFSSAQEKNTIKIQNKNVIELDSFKLDISDENIFFVVENMPEFPGDTLREFISQTVKYPGEAAKNKIQGKVFISFVVSIDGSVKNVTVARGVNVDLDKEAVRVIKSLPKWEPGTQKGKPVNVAYTVPINFVLK